MASAATQPTATAVSQLHTRPKFLPPEGSLEEAVHLGSSAADLLNKKPSAQRKHVTLVATTLLEGQYYSGPASSYIDYLANQDDENPFLANVDECVVAERRATQAASAKRSFQLASLEPSMPHAALNSPDFYLTPASTTPNPPASTLVDKWGFIQRPDVAPTPEGKKLKEHRDPKPERWPEVLAKWDSYSDDKRKKIKQRAKKAPISDKARGGVWQAFAGAFELRQEFPSLYQEARERECNIDMHQLSKDIDELSGMHAYYIVTGGRGQLGLQRVIVAVTSHIPFLTYSKGLLHFVSLLLVYMSDEEAFFTFVALCQDPVTMSFYEPGSPAIVKACRLHSQLLETCLPRLASHLAKEGLDTVVYLPQWFEGMFAYVLPHQYTVRIIDVCFADGFRVLPRFGLAVLKAMQAELLKLRFSDLVARLLSPASLLNAPPEEVVKTAIGFNVASKLEKFNKELGSK